MAAANVSALPIYLGSWINWEHGRVYGATVTLSAGGNQALSAFIGLFLAFVGIRLWTVLSFALHQAGVTNRPTSGLYRQQQIALRNFPSPASSIWVLTKQLWHWRHSSSNEYSRAIPFIVFGVIYAVGFALLSTFASSLITSYPGPLRLVDGVNCGNWLAELDAVQYNIDIQRNVAQTYHYVGDCYGPSTASSLPNSCSTYRVPAIKHAPATRDEPCPIPSLCFSQDSRSAPYVLDTGYSDSSADWGLNSPQQDRIQYRHRAVCSPINGTGFEQPAQNVTYYDFGPSLGRNWTFERVIYEEKGDPLNLFSATARTWSPQSMGPRSGTIFDWSPKPELIQNNDSYLSVAQIHNYGVASPVPVGDPVFNLDMQVETRPGGNFNFQFESRHPSTFIACTEQFELRNPQNGYTSNLTTIERIEHLMNNNMFGWNPVQNATAFLLMSANAAEYIASTPWSGGRYLKANQYVLSGLANGMPNDTWVQEVQQWFNMTLAETQNRLLNLINGPSLDRDLYTRSDLDPDLQQLCSRMLTNISDNTTSYSSLGLGLVFGLGGFLIILSWTLEPIIEHVQHHFEIGEKRRLAWSADNVFQIHRRWAEGIGQGGTWRNTEGEIPYSDAEALFFADTALKEADTDEKHDAASSTVSSPMLRSPDAQA